MIGVPYSDLQNLATNPGFAFDWVQRNVRNFYPQVKFRYIAVGNEIRPLNDATSWMTQYVLPAMQNIQNAVYTYNLHDTIRVSTAIDMTLIGNSFPPSAGVVVWDNGLGYQNLFDAMMDALYAALERAGGGSLKVVVSETGWPSAGGVSTTFENAQNYCSRLIQHILTGTPKRPQKLEAYWSATFDENNKSPEYEKHFGLFFADKRPKFSIRGSLEGSGVVYAGSSTSFTSLKSDI
ncbi:Glucan endo-1,3-beta-D-glucosidase [Heracleum sosnowskyi]|uniref:Glucan endo-1,3-beta-D-glucosidase n=1 Tax=Heracleum sosnowskyi TaxID=360622 RepID=A0AAD8GQY5_9APIA|nr:Glucan endo-1,3-beta-D-glucosidase [Heracleum sosnowskyi]